VWEWKSIIFIKKSKLHNIGCNILNFVYILNKFALDNNKGTKWKDMKRYKLLPKEWHIHDQVDKGVEWNILIANFFLNPLFNLIAIEYISIKLMFGKH
jgi:hypothetical protein